METFVWTSVSCNIELNVSAMQTSDMTAECQAAQQNLPNKDCSGKRQFLSLLYPLLYRDSRYEISLIRED